jgi:hypothetical protein
MSNNEYKIKFQTPDYEITFDVYRIVTHPKNLKIAGIKKRGNC